MIVTSTDATELLIYLQARVDRMDPDGSTTPSLLSLFFGHE